MESFIPGSEHTVESLILDSKVILQIVSDKMTMTPPYFIEVGDIMPSTLDKSMQNLLLETAEKASLSLGVENGWTHTEIKIFSNKPYVMEVAARNGGGYTVDMVKEAFGFDMRKALIDLHLGNPLDKISSSPKTVIANRIVVYGITVIRELSGIPNFSKSSMTRILSKRISEKETGIFVGPPFSYDNTVLSYFVTGQSEQVAQREFKEISSKIELKGITLFRNPNLVFQLYSFALGVVTKNKKLRSKLRDIFHLENNTAL